MSMHRTCLKWTDFEGDVLDVEVNPLVAAFEISPVDTSLIEAYDETPVAFLEPPACRELLEWLKDEDRGYDLHLRDCTGMTLNFYGAFGGVTIVLRPESMPGLHTAALIPLAEFAGEMIPALERYHA